MTKKQQKERSNGKSERRERRELTGRDWIKPYPIVSVCRADLRRFYCNAEIARLNEKDMNYIANSMTFSLLDEEKFWTVLEPLAADLMRYR